MRKITMTLAAAIFVVGSMAVANAQTQGSSSLNAQAQNATIIHKAACGAAGARRAVIGSAAHIAAGALPAGNDGGSRKTRLIQYLIISAEVYG